MVAVRPSRRMGPRSLPRAAFAAGLLSLSTAGCLALPFASPPSRVSVTYDALSKPLPKGGDTAAHIEVGVYPAGLFSSERRRRIDLGIGYGSFANDSGSVHAPYIEMQVLPYSLPIGKTGVMRAGSAVKPMLLYDDRGSAGFGSTAQLLLEVSTYVKGDFSGSDKDGGIAGTGAGELGISLHLEGVGMRVREQNVWGGGIGVDVRLPASVGIVWVWLWALLKK